ncbi:MAG: protein kinase domain-containing protein, partial [Aquimonas sp.]
MSTEANDASTGSSEAALEAPTQAVSQWVRLRRARDIDLEDPAQRRFGDFELIERLGAGGMGVVYRARQLSLEREVALKLVGVDSASGEAWVTAFRSEARHAGRLQHPNIVPVYEIGSVDHLYYLS